MRNGDRRGDVAILYDNSRCKDFGFGASCIAKDTSRYLYGRNAT